jgi:hypothetical protein
VTGPVMLVQDLDKNSSELGDALRAKAATPQGRVELGLTAVAVVGGGLLTGEGPILPRFAGSASSRAPAWAGLERPAFAGSPGFVNVGTGTLENAPKVQSATTAITPYFPVNNGFLGPTERAFLMPGTIIDRYGGSGFSRFFSAVGTPASARALPRGTALLPLRTFQVIKPFEVETGTVSPAFGQLGLGQQYMTPVDLGVLLKRGILKEVK